MLLSNRNDLRWWIKQRQIVVTTNLFDQQTSPPHTFLISVHDGAYLDNDANLSMLRWNRSKRGFVHEVGK